MFKLVGPTNIRQKSNVNQMQNSVDITGDIMLTYTMFWLTNTAKKLSLKATKDELSLKATLERMTQRYGKRYEKKEIKSKRHDFLRIVYGTDCSRSLY